MITYYGKIRIELTQGKRRFRIIARQITGNNSNDARQNLEKIISSWQNLKAYEILSLSEYPVFLKEFAVKCLVRYRYIDPKAIEYTVYAEDLQEAETVFNLNVKKWKRVESIEIFDISINKLKNHIQL